MQHGEKTFEVTAPRSRFREGGFGRLFPDLPPWKPAGADTAEQLEKQMKTIAQTRMVEAAEDGQDGVREGDPADDPSETKLQPSKLAVGYTYFGQFVDHDITLDLTPLSAAEADPNRLQNFRTPRLDLDSLYGTGPDAQPYLYEIVNGDFTGRLRVATIAGLERTKDEKEAPEGKFHDLPRLPSEGGHAPTALIGDARNDENIIVAQVHLAFLLAHNRLVSAQAKEVIGAEKFKRARRTLRWLYQWIVWWDFVQRICDPVVFAEALKRKTEGERALWVSGFDDVYNWKKHPFMPVEFSAAAYRFGHSQVRNRYKTNIFKGFRDENAIDTFRTKGRDLRGGSPLIDIRILQWDWFLTMTSSVVDVFPQRARKIDTKLARSLLHLPDGGSGTQAATNILSMLAARNLVRGVRLELPSGSSVAKNLQIEPLDLGSDPDALWFYILKEAEVGGGERLGKVGSIIVASTFAGLLLGDKQSFFNIEPNWRPDSDELLAELQKQNEEGTYLTQDAVEEEARDLTGEPFKDPGNLWRLASIIRLSQLPIDGTPFDVMVEARAAAEQAASEGNQPGAQP